MQSHRFSVSIPAITFESLDQFEKSPDKKKKKSLKTLSSCGFYKSQQPERGDSYLCAQ